uniref:Uncharacterized protein n=1 Tax=Aegilops tauschii subsp. strangulata TaxID=200361 RepID=A0A453IEH9_AEGTS
HRRQCGEVVPPRQEGARHRRHPRHRVRTVVEELAALGAAVHTCSRKEAELGERLKEWEAKGFRVTGSVCDVSVRDQRELLLQDVAGRFAGKLDILVREAPHIFSPVPTPFSICC